MPALKDTYSSVGQRHALFLTDYPHAPEPKFSAVTPEEAGIPASFIGGQDDPKLGPEFADDVVCLCVLDAGDGSEPTVAYKEVPRWEQTSSGRKVFVRSPQSWQKITTSALGRALKRRGYPDDSRDLVAVLSWRRRTTELAALAAGLPVPELTAAKVEEDIKAASKPSPEFEHAERDEDHVPASDEVVVDPDEQWSADASGLLRPLVERLTGPQRAELQGWAEGKNYGPIQQLSAGGPMRAVIARCRAMIPKDAADAPAPTETPAPGPPSAPTVQPDADPKGAAVDPNAKAPMPMVRSLWDAIQKLAGPEGDQDKAEIAFDAAEFLASDGWDEDGLTFAEVAQGWAALHSVGVYG